MRIISLSDFRKLGKDDVLTVLPAYITVEGEIKMVIGIPEQMISIGDMHPGARKIMKAHEGKIRAGMPPPEKIYT